MHDLTIIILNYNTPKLVEDCLRSVKKYGLEKTTLKIEVVVVDNGSADDSVARFKKEFSWIKILETHQNLGFAAGNNVALKQAQSRYVMLLNSDTEFTPQTQLDKLIGYLDDHQKVAVCTPKLLLSNGELDFASHRGEPTPWAAFTYFTKLAKLFPQVQLFAQYHQTYLDLHVTHQIDACSGAAMLVRTAAMKKVGLLDEAFFMYAEDLDWCHRFRIAGYQIVYNPESVIIHHKYQSGLSHKNQPLAKKTNAHFYDTMLQYYDKYYQTTYPTWVRNLIQIFIHYKKSAG